MLHELFERQARLTPHKLAVEGPDAHMSYAELNGRAHRIAQELAARGVRLSDCNPVFLAVLHHARDALRGVVEVLRWPSGWKTAEKTPRFCRRGG